MGFNKKCCYLLHLAKNWHKGAAVSRYQRTYHKIKHYELLELYTKLATREIYFPIFHFTKFPMTIVGNFDLSFPLFCLDKDNMNKYKTIAEKCGLFIRDIVIKDDVE